MSNKEKYQSLIEKYLTGNLTQDESTEIDHLKLTDTAFLELYEAEVVLSEAARLGDLEGKMAMLSGLEEEIEEVDDADLIERAARLNVLEEKMMELAKVEQEYSSRTKRLNIRSVRKWMSIAASIFLLISTVWWMNQPTAVERYFEKHFLPDDQPFTVRGAREDLLQMCYTHYDKWEWDEAIECILELKQVDDDPRHDYYLGICYLGNKEWEKAEGLLVVEKFKEKTNRIKRYRDEIRKLKKEN